MVFNIYVIISLSQENFVLVLLFSEKFKNLIFTFNVYQEQIDRLSLTAYDINHSNSTPLGSVNVTLFSLTICLSIQSFEELYGKS